MIRGNKKYLKIALALLLVGVGASAAVCLVSGASDEIEKVLAGADYVYLNDAAKDYVRTAYEKTGEVILTAENKQADLPYLNPDYAEYLALDEEEKAAVELVPSQFVVDYDGGVSAEMFNNLVGNSRETGVADAITSSDIVGASAASLAALYNFGADITTTVMQPSFDLRNVGGASYITGLNDQGNSNMCWAITTVEQAESYSMLTGEQPFSVGVSQEFSARQVDYATSTDGINNYENENGYRPLGWGGNFHMASAVMANGVALTAKGDQMEDMVSTDKKELAEVLNYGNSLYEVNGTITMPLLGRASNNTERLAYLAAVKAGVVALGGAYVGTGSPEGACASRSLDGTYIIVDSGDCHTSNAYGGHAMQIIGWNDDYQYSYCQAASGRHGTPSALGECGEGESLVAGQGAWILRNSWGENLSYVYLAYISEYPEIDFIYDLSPMSERSWDNNYHKTPFDGANASVDVQTFSKAVAGTEKLERVKFTTASIQGTYNITVQADGQTYDLGNVETALPGIYTVDVADKDIQIVGDEFTVTIANVPVDGAADVILQKSVSVFTSNVDEAPVVVMPELAAETDALEEADFSHLLYTTIKNIPSNAELTYRLMKDEQDYTEYLEVTNKKVAENNINPTVKILRGAGYGEYTLVAEYGGAEFNTRVVLPGSRVNTGDDNGDDNGGGNGDDSGQNDDSNGENGDDDNQDGNNQDDQTGGEDSNGGEDDDNTGSNEDPSNGGDGGNDEPGSNGDGGDTGDDAGDDTTSEVREPTVLEDNDLMTIGGQLLLTKDCGYVSLISKISPKPASYEHYNARGEKVVGDSALATGDIVTVWIDGGNAEGYTYQLAVLGDVNGDGEVSSADYVKIRKHIMGTGRIASGSVYYYAADISMDDEISSRDYIKVKNYIMNGGSL